MKILWFKKKAGCGISIAKADSGRWEDRGKKVPYIWLTFPLNGELRGVALHIGAYLIAVYCLVGSNEKNKSI